MSFRRSALAIAAALPLALGACGTDRATGPVDAPRYITYGTPDVNNTYANVGAFVVYDPKRDFYYALCSGTLISETAFLTAAHCTDYYTNVLAKRGYLAYVSFANPFEWGTLSKVTIDPNLIDVTQIIQDPNYTQAQNNVNDLAVLLLDTSDPDYPTGLEPARIAPLGFLDQLAAQGQLAGSTFIASGYGVQERVHETGGGSPQFLDANPVDRLYSFEAFLALNKGFLRLGQNPARGQSGACFGDSGGPNFLSYNGTLYLVAVTVTGDAVCVATNVVYRLDIQSAQAFLSQFVDYF